MSGITNFTIGYNPKVKIMKAQESIISEPKKKLAPITRALYAIYLKTEPLPPDFQPFLINRFISFNKNLQNIAFKMDRYTFGDKEMFGLIINGVIPKHIKTPWINYIKRPEEQKQELEIIFKGLQSFYGWTDRDLELAKLLIIELVKDKDNLFNILKICKADISLFKKFGFKFQMPKDESEGLAKWIGI